MINKAKRTTTKRAAPCSIQQTATQFPSKTLCAETPFLSAAKEFMRDNKEILDSLAMK